jgi:hypothetical protein
MVQKITSDGAEITAKDIRSVIESSDDFGYELRVRRVLRGHREGQLQHGGTYVDPVTGRPRQFDLRWHVFFQELGVAINLAVECKNISHETPVVICGLNRRPNESFHCLIESRAAGTFRAGSSRVSFDGPSIGVVRHSAVSSDVYPPDTFVGKSIVRIERRPDAARTANTAVRYIASKDKEIYDRWSQALASAKDLLLEARYYAHKYKLRHVFTVTLPVVVVPDDALWSAEYDEKGSLTTEPSKMDHCEFFVGREVEVPPEFPDFAAELFRFSHIHFFSLTGFANFLVDAKDLAWLNRCFPDSVLNAARAERLS